MFARSDAANGRTGLDVYGTKALPSGSSGDDGAWLSEFAGAAEKVAVREAIAAHPVETKGERMEWERDRKQRIAKKKRNDAYFPRA